MEKKDRNSKATSSPKIIIPLLILGAAFMFFLMNDIMDGMPLHYLKTRLRDGRMERTDIKRTVSKRMYVDKYHIQNDFLNNMEACRLSRLYDSDSVRYSDCHDYARYSFHNYFGYYAIDWINSKKRSIQEPWVIHKKNVRSNTDVFIDTLVYDKDSLLCAGLVIVSHPNLMKEEEISYIAYAGYLFVGYRDYKDLRFNIYLYEQLALCQDVSPESMSRNLRETFLYRGLNETVKYGLTDERFFHTPIFFDRIENGDYKFQYYFDNPDIVTGKKLFYSNDRYRDFHLPGDTTFIPYRNYFKFPIK